MASGSSRPMLTHFLAIPLTSAPASRAQLSRSIAAFRAEVTGGGFGFPSDAVRPPGSLHLTLGVMSLAPSKQGGGGHGTSQNNNNSSSSSSSNNNNNNNIKDGDGDGGDDKLARAIALLRSLKFREMLAAARAATATTNTGSSSSDAASNPGGPLKVRLRGLHTMQRDPSKATVLYAEPAPAQPLQRFCEGVVAAFMDAGLMRDEGRPLLLHATVVNTIYVKGGKRRQQQQQGGGRGSSSRLTLDARGLLDRYEDHDWLEGGMDLVLDKLAIYKFGAKSVRVDNGGGEGLEEDAAYEAVAEVEI